MVTPNKLIDDAIIEAVCLLQYETSDLPEVTIGRLSDLATWKEFAAQRLPLADVPYPIRGNDTNLKYQPIYSLKNADNSRVVQFGEKVISYHLIGEKKYCGWSKFKPELNEAFATLFERLTTPVIRRISLRYINAVVSVRHHITNVHELNLDVRVNDVRLDCPINLNYISNDATHITTTRVAHTDFVQIQNGSLPAGTSAVVDVEVTTPPNYSASKLTEIMEWIEGAHTKEKIAFFKLIPKEVLEKLKEN